MKPAPRQPWHKVSGDAAFVLHQYDWSESSLILEVFSQKSGRLALVAKGAKKPTSNFRPVLLPLQRLELAYRLQAEQDIGQLQNARWVSAYTLPKGEALLSGFYVNELLLKLLPRQDAQPALFADYAQCVALLAMQGKQSVGGGSHLPEAIDTAVILRSFELLLLRHLGHLPSLDWSAQGQALQTLAVPTPLQLWHDSGLHPLPEAEAAQGLPAVAWLQLHQALAQAAPMPALLLCLSAWPAAQRKALQNQLAPALSAHMGVAVKTRQWLTQMQAWVQAAKA